MPSLAIPCPYHPIPSLCVAGSRVMGSASAGIKRVTLELGGKSPAIVFDDANLDAATEW